MGVHSSSSLAVRIGRLSRPAGAAVPSRSKPRGDTGGLIAWMAAERLKREPGLLDVLPCDTDPETYARIQSDIARSKGDKEGAARWGARCPKPEQGCRTPREVIQALMDAGAEHSRLEQHAVEAAQRRLRACAHTCGTGMSDTSTGSTP